MSCKRKIQLIRLTGQGGRKLSEQVIALFIEITARYLSGEEKNMNNRHLGGPLKTLCSRIIWEIMCVVFTSPRVPF